MNPKTAVKLPGLNLSFPVYNGAGSFQYDNQNQWCSVPLKDLPAITLKTSAVKDKVTNVKWSKLVYVGDKFVMNCVGLQTPSLPNVIKKIRQLKKILKKPLVASLIGDNESEFIKNVECVSKEDVAAIEINLSCPNVHNKKNSKKLKPQSVAKLLQKLTSITKKPLYVKLAAFGSNTVEIAQAAESGGASAIVAVNSIPAIFLSNKTGKKILNHKSVGYSGPNIFPIALKSVYDIYSHVQIPIIGVGGIINAENVIDMMSAGATAVQIVSGFKLNENIFEKIKTKLPKLLIKLGINDVKNLIGRSHIKNK